MALSSLITRNISQHITLQPQEEEYFVSLLQPMQLKRKQVLLKEGEICKYSFFVNTGCLRGYSVDDNGFEHVLNFAPEGWWMADMYSLISQKPGVLYIDALEETELVTLSKTDQLQLYKEVPAFERFFRIITENSLVAYQQRLLDNLSLTAEERYHSFCKRYPPLINRLPSKQIAAYIGVTPEFFSKMRNKLLRQS
ncbi:cAMP-binding domain of CRP or a regulatory subunit of cAMP-dependent protein kinases [Filimonas lacunae]|uniref:cAMP-binding domain of CRP or a regulatory subunit of cAMP-dependent protein kinases n=1 Tax=Filimonas lacunae TaxID=477680 RepID=A0A173MF42_9BACT|nr:Crp/Fnr family transcriptional regulator [Filimonas lacunae]BAV06214.1 Crp/Fnr family transcriptional regulator [Filimonas lacunae]SIT25303.1 cAMP-binding domain of CRP or a regulatory subunit of cAMP-dependent protein kinases [Filimonas lacunae]